MRGFSRFVVVPLLVLSMAVAASPKNDAEVAPIVTQQEGIRQDVLDGRKKPYSDLSARQRDELLAKQEKMLKMLEGRKTLAELTEAQRIEVFNTLEWMEATINKAEDERVICRRAQQATGSHRARTVCKTVAQMREEQELARKSLQQHSDTAGRTMLPRPQGN